MTPMKWVATAGFGGCVAVDMALGDWPGIVGLALGVPIGFAVVGLVPVMRKRRPVEAPPVGGDGEPRRRSRDGW